MKRTGSTALLWRLNEAMRWPRAGPATAHTTTRRIASELAARSVLLLLKDMY
jgi:hypothetical protein